MLLIDEKISYVYGPVKSWRSGTSLGIDPIGETSTCSFNCSYCQLGKIQNITTEIKEYVPTQKIIDDLIELEKEGHFSFTNLDVITFAGSGEPTLAENLGEMILAIKKLLKERGVKIPISILTNATMLNDEKVIERVCHADLISLKLDAPNNKFLKSINQAAEGISVEGIKSGILSLQGALATKQSNSTTELQLQIMFMPKFIEDENYLFEMAKLINELAIKKIQINTPTRVKPVSKNGDYWLETRGNHYGPEEKIESPDDIELRELPVINKEQAFSIEKQLRELVDFDLEVINVYQV